MSFTLFFMNSVLFYILCYTNWYVLKAYAVSRAVQITLHTLSHLIFWKLGHPVGGPSDGKTWASTFVVDTPFLSHS